LEEKWAVDRLFNQDQLGPSDFSSIFFFFENNFLLSRSWLRVRLAGTASFLPAARQKETMEAILKKQGNIFLHA